MIEYHEVLKIIEAKRTQSNRKKIKIKIICNFNQLFLENYLNYFLHEKKIDVKILKSEFDQIDQTIISLKKKCEIDYLIVAEDINSRQNFNKNKFDNYLSQLNLRIDYLKTIKEKNPKINIIYFNLTKKNDFINDFYNELNKKILNFNKKIEKKCLNSQIQIFDIQSISNHIGIRNFYDDEKNYLAKTLYSEYALNLISKELSKQIYATQNVKKKCLVVDLDNTLWGGVLGEDGM